MLPGKPHVRSQLISVRLHWKAEESSLAAVSTPHRAGAWSRQSPFLTKKVFISLMAVHLHVLLFLHISDLDYVGTEARERKKKIPEFSVKVAKVPREFNKMESDT